MHQGVSARDMQIRISHSKDNFYKIIIRFFLPKLHSINVNTNGMIFIDFYAVVVYNINDK